MSVRHHLGCGARLGALYELPRRIHRGPLRSLEAATASGATAPRGKNCFPEHLQHNAWSRMCRGSQNDGARLAGLALCQEEVDKNLPKRMALSPAEAGTQL